MLLRNLILSWGEKGTGALGWLAWWIAVDCQCQPYTLPPATSPFKKHMQILSSNHVSLWTGDRESVNWRLTHLTFSFSAEATKFSMQEENRPHRGSLIGNRLSLRSNHRLKGETWRKTTGHCWGLLSHRIPKPTLERKYVGGAGDCCLN